MVLSFIPDRWEWVLPKGNQLDLDKKKPLDINTEPKIRGLS